MSKELATTSSNLDIRKHKPERNTTALDSQIDQLVYKLYGLTEAEIKIIENS